MSTTRCFHCHESVPTTADYTLVFDDKNRHFCCPGCLAVAQTIIDSNLADYYRFRTAPATKAAPLPDSIKNELSHYDSSDVLDDISQLHGELNEIELSIEGISCAACAWLIEKQLRQFAEIAKVNVNSTTQRCYLLWHAQKLPLSQIISALQEIGYQASPFIADKEEQSFKQELSRYLKRLAVSGIISMQVMTIAFALYFGDYTGIEQSHQGYLRWISLLLTLPVVLYSALPFLRSALRSVKSRQLNMDVPVSLAIYYTFAASAYATVFNTGEVYFESVCMFTFLLQLGKFFEFRARAKARDATSNLLKVMPVSATLVSNNEQQIVSARRLKTDDIILIKPGETIAADGVIIQGDTTVDESMLTGEYRAIEKKLDDTVLAGSVNHNGLIQVRVITPLMASRLGQIIALQHRTFSQKPALLQKTDKLAQNFIEKLLLIAVLTFLLWYFWLDPDRAFWVTLSVLVATCPCALSLAAPTAVTCSLAQLNRQGILVKNSEALDAIPDISHIVFDKTGTLTQGQFSLNHVQLFNNNYNREQVLNIIANLEINSEHPIGRAFSPFYQQPLSLSQIEITVGGGISAYHQQQLIKVGSAKFCQVDAVADAMVYLSIGEQLIASVSLQDALRPEIPRLVSQLKSKGYQLVMLTGDSSSQAEQLQQQLGFDIMHKGCSPEQKVAHIQTLVAKGHNVMMLGDGINDSPAFHAAHVSVALESGTDLSKNQADVVLLKPDLSLLLTLVKGSKLAKLRLKQNLAWAVGYNVIIIPLAVAGFVSPYIAVLGMSFSSLLVVSNSLRLLKI